MRKMALMACLETETPKISLKMELHVSDGAIALRSSG